MCVVIKKKETVILSGECNVTSVASMKTVGRENARRRDLYTLLTFPTQSIKVKASNKKCRQEKQSDAPSNKPIILSEIGTNDNLITKKDARATSKKKRTEINSKYEAVGRDRRGNYGRNTRTDMKANVKLTYLFPSIECWGSVLGRHHVNITVSMMKAICFFVLDAD